VTLDFAEVVAATGSTGDIDVNAATSLTINAAKDMFFDEISAGSSKLTTLTVNGSDKVEIDDVLNTAVLATVEITGADNVDLGLIADADKLATLSVTSTAGSVTTDQIGDNAATSTDPENIAITLSAGTTVTAGIIEADKMGDVTITGGEGTVQVDELTSAADGGTFTITATKGAIDLGDGTDGIITADTTGITVDMSATTFISDDGTNVDNDAIVTNSRGDITASLAGAAAANVNYTAGTANTAARSGTVNLDASALTGGLTSTIDSNEMEETTAAGQTISLGAKNSSTVNTITLTGFTSGTTVTGSAGKDTVVNSAGGDALSSNATNSNDTYNLGGGTDTLSYAGNTHDALSGTSDAGATTDGYAFNASGSTYTFFSTAASTTTNKTTIAANTVAQYDSTATASTTATAGSIVAGGETDTFSSVEVFVGSGKADYFIANSSGGMTFTGGAGDDTYVLSSGTDTITIAFGGEGEDTINSFTAGASGDVIDLTGTSNVGASVTNAAKFAIQANADNAATQLVNGLTVIDNNDGTNVSADSLSVADVATYLADTDGTGSNTDAITVDNAGTTDDVYIIVSDGTDSAMFFVEHDDGDGTIDSDELTLIATFAGISDAGTFTADNFSDFTA